MFTIYSLLTRTVCNGTRSASRRTDSGLFSRQQHTGAQPATTSCGRLPSPGGTNSGAECSAGRTR